MTFTTIRLQERIDARLARAAYLNIKLACAKSEFIHLLPRTSAQVGTDEPPLRVGTHHIPQAQARRSLEVWIERCFTFKTHRNSIWAKGQRKCAWLAGIARRKGSSPATVHYMATTTILPTQLYGAEAWWDGTRMVLDRLAPTYHQIAHLITGLSRFT